ncbi:MAG: hypothetical protein ACRD4A_08835, partial [Candidatus Acidiferrales bacterium]
MRDANNKRLTDFSKKQPRLLIRLSSNGLLDLFGGTMPKRKLAQILLVAAIAALALAGWTGYREHLRVTAWVWHVRHGGVLKCGDYLIPVPANWYVNDSGPGTGVLVRLDHAKELSSNEPYLPATISLLEEPPLKDINYWESFVTSGLKKKGPVFQREISLGGETLACVGGNTVPAVEAMKTKIPTGVSWDCRSAGSLEILITGQEDDLKQVWDIVSRIRLIR